MTLGRRPISENSQALGALIGLHFGTHNLLMHRNFVHVEGAIGVKKSSTDRAPDPFTLNIHHPSQVWSRRRLLAIVCLHSIVCRSSAS